jgi:hypothetical protein
LKKKRLLEDIIVVGMIIIKFILKEYDRKFWTGFVSEEGPMAGSCKQGNETSGSTNAGGISWLVQQLLATE